MRVLFVIRSLDLGGAERQCCSLAVGLRTRGHTVLVASLASGGTLAPELESQGVELLECAHRGPRDLLRSGFRIRRIAKKFSPDVTYSFMSASNVLCAVFLPKSSHRSLVWGVRASWIDHPGYGLLTRLVLKVEGWLSRIPGLIISNSRAGADYHTGLGYPSDRLRIVENSIDSATFNFSATTRADVRSRLAVDAARKVVALVARIDPIKGHDCYLAAAALVASRRKDVDFWCIGGGNKTLMDALQQKAKELGLDSRMRWHGEVREVGALVGLLCAADLSVSASLAEGFPNTVAEALACGLQVVGTDAGDTRRIIGNLGECVPVGDAEAMAEAILRQLDQQMSRELVRADVLGRFAPQLLMDRHERLLREVAAQSQLDKPRPFAS